MMEFVIGMCVGAAIVLVQQHLWKTAPLRQARYRMRARVARWVMEGRLHPVKTRKGKLVINKRRLQLRKSDRADAPERRTDLPTVRRDDQVS